MRSSKRPLIEISISIKNLSGYIDAEFEAGFSQHNEKFVSHLTKKLQSKMWNYETRFWDQKFVIWKLSQIDFYQALNGS